MYNENKCYECGEIFDSQEYVNRHIKKHKITLQAYILKWKHDEKLPTCACGCGKPTLWNVAQKNYTTYVHGHHMVGRTPTEETKEKIGRANSTKMKEYMQQNPDIAKQRVKQMLDGRTPESEVYRIEKSKAAIANETLEQRGKRSIHAKKLWNNGKLRDAHIKASKTWKARHATGVYAEAFEIARMKLSQIMTQKYLDGGFQWAHGFHISTKTQRKSYYRSSWELQFMNILDVDPDVIDWESEFTSIPYLFEGNEHRYVPDFHVTRINGNQLVEIKPISLRQIPRNIAKRDAAIKFCDDIKWEYIEWDPSMINFVV
jgi:hypothetical protein